MGKKPPIKLLEPHASDHEDRRLVPDSGRGLGVGWTLIGGGGQRR